MTMAWLLAAGVVVALGNAAAAKAGAVAEVEVRLTDHRSGIADFRRLDVGLEAVSIHARGNPRTSGWHDLVGATPPVDIVPLKDGRYEILGKARLPAGRYDAVRVRFASVEGDLHSAKATIVAAQDATLAIDADFGAQAGVWLLVDLFAEDQTDHEPRRYVVKVRDVLVGG